MSVELPFKLRLPESEFGLELCVEWGEVRGLGIDQLEAVGEGSGRFGDGSLEFRLLFGCQAGDGGGGILAVLDDELRLERFGLFRAQVGDLVFEHDDLGAGSGEPKEGAFEGLHHR